MPQKEAESEIHLVLPNSKYYENGKGIDIDVVCSLKEIKRCPSFSVPGKFSVPEHLWLCGLIVPAYCEYLVDHLKETEYARWCGDVEFKYKLIQKVMAHDLEEVVFNDIPLPIKMPELEAQKTNVRNEFKKFLQINDVFDDTSVGQILEMCLKHIDCLAALIEINWYVRVGGVKNVENLKSYYEKKVRQFGLLDFFCELYKIKGFSNL